MTYLHDYIEKCPRCGKFMTAEQVKHHVCNSPLIDVKEIPILYHFETCDKNGNALIVARGLDGVLYRMTQCQNPLSDDSYHDASNRRQVTRTKNRKEYIYS